jgi:hypothetical protein
MPQFNTRKNPMRKTLMSTSLALLFLLFVPLQLNCQEAEKKSIRVFEGGPATIDGKIEEAEWKDSSDFEMANGGKVFLKHDGEFMYVGVRGVKAGWSHFYLRGGTNDVSVIHASAALGQSLYRLDQNRLWQPANEFQWELRDRTVTVETQKKMDDYLSKNRWVSSNNNMGNPGEIEFKVKTPTAANEPFYIALVYATNGVKNQYFPATLADDTLKQQLLSGNTPNDLKFTFDQWARITFVKARR